MKVKFRVKSQDKYQTNWNTTTMFKYKYLLLCICDQHIYNNATDQRKYNYCDSRHQYTIFTSVGQCRIGIPQLELITQGINNHYSYVFISSDCRWRFSPYLVRVSVNAR